jgi:hypothetical protein
MKELKQPKFQIHHPTRPSLTFDRLIYLRPHRSVDAIRQFNPIFRISDSQSIYLPLTWSVCHYFYGLIKKIWHSSDERIDTHSSEGQLVNFDQVWNLKNNKNNGSLGLSTEMIKSCLISQFSFPTDCHEVLPDRLLQSLYDLGSGLEVVYPHRTWFIKASLWITSYCV